eukprot:6672-Eustigmatos_ZCMA.PRE.1
MYLRSRSQVPLPETYEAEFRVVSCTSGETAATLSSRMGVPRTMTGAENRRIRSMTAPTP